MATDINFIKAKDSLHIQKISSKESINLDFDGYLIEAFGDEKETRKIVDFLKGKRKQIYAYGNNNLFNRRVLETMKINGLISPEKEDKRDTLKQRDSGLNHVTMKIAKKNQISLIINMSELKEFNPSEKSKVISRIIQNIKIARKEDYNIKIASFGNSEKNIISKKERENFLLTLGASTIQTKESCKF